MTARYPYGVFMPKKAATPKPSHTEQPVTSEESILAAQQSLPDPDGCQDIASLRETLRPLPIDAQIEAVARAITLQKLPDLNYEREQINRKRAYVFELDGAIRQLDVALAPVREKLTTCAGSLQNLARVDLKKQRFTSSMSGNDVVGMFDHLHDLFTQQVAPLIALARNLDRYVVSSDEILEHLDNTTDLEEEQDTVDLLAEHTESLMRTIDHVEGRLRDFPEFCSLLFEATHSTLQDVQIEYGPQDDEQSSRSKYSSKRGQYYRSPRSQNVPLYQDNLFLTAYLHDIALRIPTPSNTETETKKLVRSAEYAPFINYLKAHADVSVNQCIRSQHAFENVSSALRQIHAAFHDTYLALKSSKVLEIRRDERLSVSASYLNIERETTQELSGEADGLETFRVFDSSPIFDFLENIETQLDPKTTETAGSSTHPATKKDAEYTQLFQHIDRIVIGLMSGSVGNPELEKFLQETAPLVRSTRNSHSGRDPFKREVQLGNFAFDVRADQMGELSLERIAAQPHSYDDLIGESWERATAAVSMLKTYTQLHHIYSHMTVRGQLNTSMLIVGPYGCGKNLFLKALMADPKIIGINMSSDRIMSMWYGQSERHIRELFELSHEKRQQYEKPAIIGWDEFDSLFVKQSATGTSLQKTLQGVLQGDTHYDGVGLVALSNEPDKIPMAIWRRFARVLVIDPLTAEERRKAMLHMLSGVPLSPNFEKVVDWEQFERSTGDASGDVLGKIFDSLYSSFAEHIAETHGVKALLAINAAAADHMREAPLNQDSRCEIFATHAPDVHLTPQEFRRAYTKVLAQVDVQNAMKRQARFYHELDKKLNDAVFEE